MNPRRTLRLLLAILTCLAPAAAFAAAPLPDHWVSTWSTANVAAPNPTGSFGDGSSQGTTLREIVHVSLGGSMARVAFSNVFGKEPLTLGEVHVAVSAGNSSVQLMSANALTFGAKPSITIPAGAEALSDPFALTVPAGSDLAISIFLPAQTISVLSMHPNAFQTSYFAPGNQVNAANLATPLLPATAKTITSWDFLKSVQVLAPGDTGTVIAFGDSITDGAASTIGANARWPDVLARRLQKDKKTRRLGVINEGIGGNRILHDGAGDNALKRFDRDVLAQPGVQYLILLEAINDIGHAADPNGPTDVVTADDLIQGLAQMAARAHVHGIKVYAATLTPYTGAKYASPAGEAMRTAYNQWIRTSNTLDGFIDFEKATADSGTGMLKQAFDSGDHLHPSDAGYKAMGEAINLKLFEAKK